MPAPRSIFPTACECTDPGWCTRHQCHKNRVHFENCRRLQSWFDLWERGDGPSSQAASLVVAREPCRHLGDETRRQDCPTCSGRVVLKICACEIHGECALSLKVADLVCCQTCADYEAPS